MYKLQNEPDDAAVLKNGTTVKPLMTLKDEHGGVSHIIEDDHCFVLINGSCDKEFEMTPYWYWEAAEALTKMVSVKGR